MMDRGLMRMRGGVLWGEMWGEGVVEDGEGGDEVVGGVFGGRGGMVCGWG